MDKNPPSKSTAATSRSTAPGIISDFNVALFQRSTCKRTFLSPELAQLYLLTYGPDVFDDWLLRLSPVEDEGASGGVGSQRTVPSLLLMPSLAIQPGADSQRFVTARRFHFCTRPDFGDQPPSCMPSMIPLPAASCHNRSVPLDKSYACLDCGRRCGTRQLCEKGPGSRTLCGGCFRRRRTGKGHGRRI